MNPEKKREYIQILVELPDEYRIPEMPHGLGTLAVRMSEKGLFIQCIKDLPVGTQVKIAFLFPEEERATVVASAETISKEMHWEEDWEGYQYGLKFMEEDGKSCGRFERLLWWMVALSKGKALESSWWH